jgi:hypothetical protein
MMLSLGCPTHDMASLPLILSVCCYSLLCSFFGFVLKTVPFFVPRIVFPAFGFPFSPTDRPCTIRPFGSELQTISQLCLCPCWSRPRSCIALQRTSLPLKNHGRTTDWKSYARNPQFAIILSPALSFFIYFCNVVELNPMYSANWKGNLCRLGDNY